MSYVKQNFSGGQVLTATNLNHMEEGIAAAGTVKSVNGVMPDENGNISSTIVKQIAIVDGSAVIPNNINYYGYETIEEIANMLRDTVGYDVTILRYCMLPGGKTRVVEHTDYEFIMENGKTVGVKVFHGDDLCPFILDVVSNKITFDPDWVAPAAMPETTEAHKQLVTDAEGKMAWEDRLAYSTLEEQIFIEEAVWDGTQLVFPVSVVNANDGDRIIVYIDGVAYPGVAGNVNPFNIEVIFDEGVKCPWQPNASMKFYVSVPGMSMNLGGQPLSWCVGTMYATIMAEKHHPIRQEYLGVNVKAGKNNTGVIVGGNNLSVASGDYSVSLSGGTATGSYSTAIGGYAEATYSFAQGNNSFAKGRASSAFGKNTVSTGENSMVMGKYNIKDEESKYMFIAGNGTQGTEYIDGQGWNHTYSNAHTLDWNGNAWFAGTIKAGGTGQDDAEAIDVVDTLKSLDKYISFTKQGDIIRTGNITNFEDAYPLYSNGSNKCRATLNINTPSSDYSTLNVETCLAKNIIGALDLDTGKGVYLKFSFETFDGEVIKFQWNADNTISNIVIIPAIPAEEVEV